MGRVDEIGLDAAHVSMPAHWDWALALPASWHWVKVPRHYAWCGSPGATAGANADA